LTVLRLQRLFYNSIHQRLLILLGAGDVLLLLLIRCWYLFVHLLHATATSHAAPLVMHHLIGCWLLLCGTT
jgi:hypothetical protein